MIRVSDLPRQRRFKFDPESVGRLTHHLFRFPAKFHPPVVRQLIQDYTEEGETILDPFCGSGTLLVEASVLGRNSIGIDIDPLSVFVTNVKVHALRKASIEDTTAGLAVILDELQRTPQELKSSITGSTAMPSSTLPACLRPSKKSTRPRRTATFSASSLPRPFVELRELIQCLSQGLR
jgi:hypothetical protein